MQERQDVTFARECTVVVIPDGYETTVPEGTPGILTQVLGGNFTVQLMTGHLVRVRGDDADTIGQDAPAPTEDARGPDGRPIVTTEQIWSELRQCYDPEIPVNIVALGLIYSCEVTPTDTGGYKVEVQMTLTAPGCGMGQILQDDVAYRIRAIPGVAETDIELVFDPPWSPERMSEEAKLELGF